MDGKNGQRIPDFNETSLKNVTYIIFKYIFTPLLLIPLALNKFAGLAIAGAMFIASTAANIITIYKYHYGPTYTVVGWVDPEEKHPE